MGDVVGVLIKAAIFFVYALLLLRPAGKTIVGTASIFGFVSTVATGTIICTTIISPSLALSNNIAGLTALVALQWLVAYASSRSGCFYRRTTNTPRCSTTARTFIAENLHDGRITRDHVKAKIREGGHPTLESVAALVSETTGDVALISSSAPTKPAELAKSL